MIRGKDGNVCSDLTKQCAWEFLSGVKCTRNKEMCVLLSAVIQLCNLGKLLISLRLPSVKFRIMLAPETTSNVALRPKYDNAFKTLSIEAATA